MQRILCILAVCVGCSGDPPSSAPVRLVDSFSEALVEGTPEDRAASYEPTLWSFADGQLGWTALQGIDEFRVQDGALRGRTISAQPVLTVEPSGEVPATEVLYAVEVRARVSAGTRMEVRFASGADLVLPRVLGNPLGAFTSPLQPGQETHTYLIRATSSVSPEEIRHVVLTPTNEANADFVIESVRLVFRGEHLRSIASGVGWHGMSDIYNETIVTRSPERVRYTIDLPSTPRLTVNVATIERTPVTFRIEARDRAWQQTIEEPDVWHEAALDLEGLDGERVELILGADAEESGALAFWGAPAVRSRALVEGQPRAVVLVITDTLRADHLGLYGYERETAPTLTRIAREGVWFRDTISQSTWTKVSVPTIQTSLYPSTHTVADIPDRLPAAATTIAEVYRAAGYATMALTSIPFVGQLTNLHQGYEVLHETGSIPAGARNTAGVLAPRLRKFMEAHRDTPFFAMLHVRDAHSPYRPAEEYETTFAETGDMDELDQWIEKVRPHIEDPLMRRFGMPRRSELLGAGIDPEAFVRHEVNGMDGKIRGIDDALATVFETLEELGLRERALVAVVADHGTELLEHDEHFHGHSVYGELNRVPMVLWGPGFVESGRRVDATVQTLDLMPTLLELSGLPVPDAAQGQSLRPLFDGGANPRWNRPAFTELPARPRADEARAVLSDGWKLVRIQKGGETRLELYSHVDDPLNQVDVSADHPDIVARLNEVLENWHGFAEAARLDEAATGTMDAAELERLRSLGYVQ